MGAWFTSQIAAGKTPAEAYRRAVEDATAYHGHQDGYSGAINSKASGFVLVALPPRFTYQRFLALADEFEQASAELEESLDDVRAYEAGGIWSGTKGAKSQLRKAQARAAKAKRAYDRLEAKVPAPLFADFARLVRQMNDKWEAPLAVELRGAEAKRYANVSRRRGERLYIFFGYAPS